MEEPFAISEREVEQVFPTEVLFGPRLKEVRGWASRYPGHQGSRPREVQVQRRCSWKGRRAESRAEWRKWGWEGQDPGSCEPTHDLLQQPPLRDSAGWGWTVLYLLNVGKLLSCYKVFNSQHC